MQRATAIAEVAAELANAARMQDLPEIVQRGAQVLGAQSSALAVFDPDDGPLRLHMTNRLTDGPGPRRLPRGRPRDRAGRGPADPVRRDARPAGAAGRPGRGGRPFPATKDGLEVLNIHAVAALPLRVEGRILGAFTSLCGRPSTRSPRRRRGARGARRADRAERLPAAGRRGGSAVAAMGEANQLKLLAEAGGSSRARWRSTSRSGAGRARRARSGRLVLARRERRAGPAARHGLGPP